MTTFKTKALAAFRKIAAFCKKWWKELLFLLAFVATFLFKRGGPVVVTPKEDPAKADRQIHQAETQVRTGAAEQLEQAEAHAADAPTAEAAGKLDKKERELAEGSAQADHDADAANAWADQVGRRKP